MKVNRDVALGTVPTVVIHCEDGHKRRKVQTYVLDRDRTEWQPVVVSSRRQRVDGAPRAEHPPTGRADVGGTQAHLVDDAPQASVKRWIAAAAEAERVGIDARKRGRVTCSSCEMSVPVRDERLQAVLNTLWESQGPESSGVLHLSLRGLDAVV